MSKNDIKNLKTEIKRLREENEFLERGIDSREEVHNFISEQRDKAMAATQELTFLLVYLEAIEALLKDDFSSNSRTIKKAINKFKSELIDGFGANHLIHKLLNNNEDNDIIV